MSRTRAPRRRAGLPDAADAPDGARRRQPPTVAKPRPPAAEPPPRRGSADPQPLEPSTPPPPRLVALALFVARVIVRMRAIGLSRTAASLSFTTLLALVPLATVALTFVARFPIFQRWLDTLETFLLKHMLPSSAYNVVHHYIGEFTEKAAGLTGVSILFIALTAAMATATIEREINLIWGIARLRPLGRRVVVYALGLTAGPVLVGASLSLTTWFITESLAAVPLHASVTRLALKPLPLAFTAIALTLLYAVVPARRVPWRHAFAGGALAAIVFEATKHAFAFYLTHVATYELVYGALAVLPVFLIWIYLCWMIVLAGAAITATLTEPPPPAVRERVESAE
jgi:membrane protein